MRHAALVWNGGSGLEELETVRSALAPHFELDVLATSPERGAEACAREALARGAELLIAAGGDGTVSRVAGVLVGTDVPLGILARGTSNSIAAGLGIPIDLEGAVATIAAGERLRVDTARAAGRAMLLHASVGLHATAITHASKEAKSRWGALAYVMEGLKELGTLEPFAVEIETERATFRCRATNVLVANVSPLKSLLSQGPGVHRPDDGRLDVTILAAAVISDVVATALHLLWTGAQGEPATRDDVGFLSARSVRITTDPAQPVLVDGDTAGEGSLTIECVPRSLDVIGAKSGDDARACSEDKLEGLPGLQVELKEKRP